MGKEFCEGREYCESCDSSDISDDKYSVFLDFGFDDEIEVLIQSYAKKIEKSILVRDVEGGTVNPLEDRPQDDEYDLVIYSYSSPISVAQMDICTIYGMSVCEINCFCLPKKIPTKWKAKKLYDPNGFEVGLIIGNKLYLLFDFLNCGDDEDSRVVLLNMILDDYYLYLKHKILFNREMKKRSEGKVFQQFCHSYRLGYGDADSEEICNSQERINELRNEVSLHARIKKFKTVNLDDLDKRIFDLYDSLCKFSTTGKIVIKDDYVKIPIGQIDIENEGVIRDIGEFDLFIYFFSNTIKCYNNTRKIDGHSHPNVNSYGKLFFGDASYGVGVLIGEMEIDTVAKMAIDLLKSYNPNDRYASIEKWPVKEVVNNG